MTGEILGLGPDRALVRVPDADLGIAAVTE